MNEDIYFFSEGTNAYAYRSLGAFVEKDATRFSVWAPNAEAVSVVGDFNQWKVGNAQLHGSDAGIFTGMVKGVGHGALYKYAIKTRGGEILYKADPYARYGEVPPGTASRVWKSDYAWQDEDWLSVRAARQAQDSPISIYEMHLGSWQRDGDRFLTYRELAPRVAAYVKKLGFTHVELMPIMEHPFYGSWGYQVLGYFSPSARYGTPDDFRFFVDTLHAAGVGVILDWVPSHFPTDPYGLGDFDGTHLYEHADPRKGFHPDWKSYIFNYGRNEVRSFLLSSAIFWLDEFHADALRVDGVASMLYLDYSRKAGEWIANEGGGRENWEAVEFLRRLNISVFRHFPDAQTFAEESTAWPGVSHPTESGGLGFGFKWDMGWMHDTLKYFAVDSLYRKYHQNDLTFRAIYMGSENFTLPLSHDEVVYGKGSLVQKMSGDIWQKFANLRLLYAYMFAQPGKKLLFMGAEFAQWSEWAHDGALDWGSLQDDKHARISLLVGDLNHLYASEAALQPHTADSFQWISANDSEQSVLAFLRTASLGERPGTFSAGASVDPVVCVFNFTPVPRDNYRIGVPTLGVWRELLNTDSEAYGGTGRGNFGGAEARPIPLHGHEQSVSLTLPPLGAVFLKV